MNINHELLMAVAKAVICILTVVCYRYVIPYLKAAKENQENEAYVKALEQLRIFVEDAVRCAEQTMKIETGKERKDYVLDCVANKINELGIGMIISAEDINILIEAAVKTMNIEQGK